MPVLKDCQPFTPKCFKMLQHGLAVRPFISIPMQFANLEKLMRTGLAATQKPTKNSKYLKQHWHIGALVALCGPKALE